MFRIKKLSEKSRETLGVFFGVPLILGFLYILWAITVAL